MVKWHSFKRILVSDFFWDKVTCFTREFQFLMRPGGKTCIQKRIFVSYFFTGIKRHTSTRELWLLILLGVKQHAFKRESLSLIFPGIKWLSFTSKFWCLILSGVKQHAFRRELWLLILSGVKLMYMHSDEYFGFWLLSWGKATCIQTKIWFPVFGSQLGYYFMIQPCGIVSLRIFWGNCQDTVVDLLVSW